MFSHHLRPLPKFLRYKLERGAPQRHTHLVRNIWNFPGSREKKPIGLNRAIESTITVATSEWKYVAELETDFDPSLPSVPCLAGEINQVVLSIVVNAAHALAQAGRGERGEMGRIRIGTRQDGDHAVIEISDTGRGMPEEIRQKVFDPFFTTKAVGKGTRQGLAIAHSVVVDKHAGTIEVESEQGRGTTFRIRLPIRSASGAGEPQERSA